MPQSHTIFCPNSFLPITLSLFIASLSGCHCYDPCGYYEGCYNPCGGYATGMSYNACVNDLPTLYGMHQNYAQPASYCTPATNYCPPTMGCPTMMGGECYADSCQSEMVYGMPEPTMAAPYGHYAYREKQHHHKHKVSWTQKVKNGWKKTFGPKPCECEKCRHKRRHQHHGEIHADECPCQACLSGEEYVMHDGFDGEVYDGEIVDGEVIYDGGMTSLTQPSQGSNCPTCQRHGSCEIVYEGEISEGEMLDESMIQGDVIEGEIIQDDGGMTQSYPEYGGRHFAPPVPTMERAVPENSSGATLNGEIMHDEPAHNPAPQSKTFQSEPTSEDDAPAPTPPVPYEDGEFSQPRPMPDDNVSLKPLKNYREALMLPPTWDEVQTSHAAPASQATASPSSAEPEWTQAAPNANVSSTTVYSKPSARPYYKPVSTTMDEKYRTPATNVTTRSVSYEQPMLLPPAPEPRKLKGVK